jgi:hypothetical protein
MLPEKLKIWWFSQKWPFLSKNDKNVVTKAALAAITENFL